MENDQKLLNVMTLGGISLVGETYFANKNTLKSLSSTSNTTKHSERASALAISNRYVTRASAIWLISHDETCNTSAVIRPRGPRRGRVNILDAVL